MNILNRLFVSSSRQKRPNIDQLLSADNIAQSIIEIDDYICNICEWGKNLDKLSEEQKYFYFNQNLEKEINNGGFSQYFLNSSGDFANETIISLSTIKAYKSVEILQQAIDQFPDKRVPKDRDKRFETLSQIQEKANPIWQQLDQKFLQYEENLNDLNIEFIRQHRDSFK
jgi:hypothetical protein